MKLPYSLPSDRRFTISSEFTGHIPGKPRFVIHFCGERIADTPTLGAALMRATGERLLRNGQQPIEGIPANS